MSNRLVAKMTQEAQILGIQGRNKAADLLREARSKIQDQQKQLTLISGIVGDGELCDVSTQVCDFVQALSEENEKLRKENKELNDACNSIEWP